MDYNPFEAPQSARQAVGVLSGSREDLKRIAVYQKNILVCILVYFIAVFGQFALPDGARILVAIGVLCIAIVGAVFTFLLAMKTYGSGLGILLGVLCLLPLVGLLVLLAVNGKATRVLKQNGIRVGLLGADLSSI